MPLLTFLNLVPKEYYLILLLIHDKILPLVLYSIDEAAKETSDPVEQVTLCDVLLFKFSIQTPVKRLICFYL